MEQVNIGEATKTDASVRFGDTAPSLVKTSAENVQRSRRIRGDLLMGLAECRYFGNGRGPVGLPGAGAALIKPAVATLRDLSSAADTQAVS